MTVAATKPCPFCGSTATSKVSDFATSVMVAGYRCQHCKSYFEAIKWGDRTAALDVPAFLDEPRPPQD